jgi:hypothetical protein
MNRKLVFDSTESEKRREAVRLAPDPPPFNLDTPSDDDKPPKEFPDQVRKAVAQEGCNKWYSDPSSNSITPVVHEYEKRLVRTGKFEKSPYINYEIQKNLTVSKPVECL